MSDVVEKLRVRVRPLGRAADWEVASAWSNRLCLSTPHVGEAIDFASDAYRLKNSSEAVEGRKLNDTRILHYGHELGRPCESGEAESAGRCLIVDYVPRAQERSQDEIDVSGLVALGKAG